MPPFVVRRSERIDYRVPVTLFAARDNIAPVIARSVDVSEGGMRVYAPIPVPVGAPVRCEISLDGRSATLEGRVAWLADHAPEATPGLGMGIRFETLSREDSGVLRHIVARATEGYMPAELELSGVRAPVAARAMPTSDGARISASLPWLRRGAPVGVHFVGVEGDLRGRVADAELRELPSGGRRLQIDVEAEAPQRGRRDTRYGDALDFERARRLTPEEVDDADAIDVDGIPGLPSYGASRARTWAVFALGVLIGGGGVAAAMTLLTPSGGERSSQASAQLAHAARSASAMTPIAAPAPKPQPPAQASLAAVEPPKEPRSEPAALDAVAERKAQESPLLATPTATIANGTTLVRVPVRGTLEAVSARIWADPHALALDLPHAQTDLANGRYALGAGAASFVRVQRRSDATLLRIGLAHAITNHAVALHGDVLEVRLTSREADKDPSE